MRTLLAALLLSGCGTVKVCEFDVHVRVTPDADTECRAAGATWNDAGKAITDTARILGCAPKGGIITNGTESNMGHEMKHQKDRNCGR